MTKDIEKPTLAEKQAFWTEQLPLFKEAYWLPEHFELLKFDMDAGNFVVHDDLDPTFEDDADELYHRINTGWSMWKRAVNHVQEKLEGSVVVNVRSDSEIIDQTIELMDLLATSTNRFQRDPNCLFPFESNNPRVKEWWRTACQIQELLTNTDPTNCDFDEYKTAVEAARGGNE